MRARTSADRETTLPVEALAAARRRVPDDDELDVEVAARRRAASGSAPPEGDLTVFVDAWSVDLEGPDELVQPRAGDNDRGGNATTSTHREIHRWPIPTLITALLLIVVGRRGLRATARRETTGR